MRATHTAIACLVTARERLKGATPNIPDSHLDLTIRRLRALQKDLVRSRQRGGDALFTTFGVAQVALGSLSTSVGEIHSTLKRLIPFDEPTPGWFVDGGLADV